MKVSKGKISLIKNYIPRDVNPARRNIKALKSLMLSAIAKKSTAGRSKGELDILFDFE